MKTKFIEINEDIGWDASVDYIVDNTTDERLLALSKEYYSGYFYCKDGDIDGGKCFEIRAKAIQDIIAYLETDKLSIALSLLAKLTDITDKSLWNDNRIYDAELYRYVDVTPEELKLYEEAQKCQDKAWRAIKT